MSTPTTNTLVVGGGPVIGNPCGPRKRIVAAKLAGLNPSRVFATVQCLIRTRESSLQTRSHSARLVALVLLTLPLSCQPAGESVTFSSDSDLALVLLLALLGSALVGHVYRSASGRGASGPLPAPPLAVARRRADAAW